ncbi:MAG: adenylate/guanylate cyclase domain-containing protein [Polyangiales bacterium]
MELEVRRVLSSTEILVLFLTDVEGSCYLWENHAPSMLPFLDQLDAVVERVITAHGGVVEKTRGEGDSHFIVFRQASSATRAAAVLQRELAACSWPGDLAPKLRIGLHAGEVQRRGHEYAGIAVNRAARLRAVAHGGQVVASRAVVELVSEPLEPGLAWSSLGPHRIRDLPGWTEVFQLHGVGLPREFPALVTLDTGLPPLAAIVMHDAIGTLQRLDALSDPDGEALHGQFSAIFAHAFTGAKGQYIQFLGDGCLAIFADPHAALRFTREVRGAFGQMQMQLRSAIHYGRVQFTLGGPYGRAVARMTSLMRQNSHERIVLSATAAAVLELADDLALAKP